MSFKDWHLAMYGVYPGTGIKVNGFEARKEGWNAALEQAAIKVLLRGDRIGGAVDPDLTAKEIRSLKEE